METHARTVLVAEDSQIDARIAENCLKKGGDWRVVRVSNGQEALDAIPQLQPDVIVTDMIMPELDGLALVTKVAANYPHIPVVLMTSRGNEEIAGQALERGAASYVPKIHMNQVLVDTVRRVVDAAEDSNFFAAPLHLAIRNDIEFILPNDVSAIRSVAIYLQAAITGIALHDRRQAFQIRTGIEEAMLNAMYHGNLELGTEELSVPSRREDLVNARLADGRHVNRRIFVSAQISASKFTFEIRDEGPGFEISRLPAPDDRSHFDSSSGRGLALMRTFFDSVEYSPRGNAVRLFKQIVLPATS